MSTPQLVILRRNGRPYRSDGKSDRDITVRVTMAERAEVARVAAENGVTVSEVVRDAVNCYVADYSERSVFQRRTK